MLLLKQHIPPYRSVNFVDLEIYIKIKYDLKQNKKRRTSGSQIFRLYLSCRKTPLHPRCMIHIQIMDRKETEIFIFCHSIQWNKFISTTNAYFRVIHHFALCIIILIFQRRYSLFQNKTALTLVLFYRYEWNFLYQRKHQRVVCNSPLRCQRAYNENE